MELDELIEKINQCADEFDFVTARKYIEENIEILKNNKLSLNSNAREILNFLTEQLKSGVKPLSKSEINIINAINSYAYKFDLMGIKFLLKNNAQVFMKKDSMSYLNSDAKTLLSGMKVINN